VSVETTEAEIDHLWVERCRKLAGAIRLLRAVKSGVPAEDPVRLDLQEAEELLRAEGFQTGLTPDKKSQPRLRLYTPEGDEC
jgi:hypothetical protein